MAEQLDALGVMLEMAKALVRLREHPPVLLRDLDTFINDVELTFCRLAKALDRDPEEVLEYMYLNQDERSRMEAPPPVTAGKPRKVARSFPRDVEILVHALDRLALHAPQETHRIVLLVQELAREATARTIAHRILTHAAGGFSSDSE